MALFLLPLLLLVALAILVLEGRPILYVSNRRIDGGPPVPVMKFRTMRRDAERIANRETVPVRSQRFLNLPTDSPLYTPIGRLIERYMLTEMPQLWHVLLGRMSVVGNRPLPQNVVESLGVEYRDVEDRFLVQSGLTGPVQLVGRDAISDAERLSIEVAYCNAVLHGYSPLLDLKILAYTILSGSMNGLTFTPSDVHALIARHASGGMRRIAPRRPGEGAAPGFDGELDDVRERAHPATIRR